MKKILVIGAGAFGLGIAKVLADKNIELNDVVIVTPENVEQHKDEIMAQSQFEPEPIMIQAQQKFEDDIFISKVNEKPFWQTMKKNKKKKR